MKYFTPSEKIKQNAKLGLELRAKHGRGGLSTREAGELGIGSGVQRANDLIEGNVSLDTIRRMKAFFDRHSAYKEHHESDPPSNSYISWLLWGGDEAYSWAKEIIEEEDKDTKKGLFFSLLTELDTSIAGTINSNASNIVINKANVDFNDNNQSHPERYFTGLDEETKRKRELIIEQRQKQGITGSKLYEDLPGDDVSETSPSKYTNHPKVDEIRNEMKDNSKEEFIRAAAKVSKVDKDIIEQVYDKGLKAWATSGHRPGATPQQWAIARVYAFLFFPDSGARQVDQYLWDKHLDMQKRWVRLPMKFDYSGIIKPKKKARELKTPDEKVEPLHRNPREDDPSLPLRDRIKRQQKHGGKFEFLRAVNYITNADPSLLDKMFTDALTEYFSTKQKQATSGMEYAMNKIFDWLDSNIDKLDIKKSCDFSFIDLNNELKVQTESLMLNKK